MCKVSPQMAFNYLKEFKPQHRRRLANWTECTKCDGRGNTKEFVARYGCDMPRECSRCNGDGGYYGVPAEIQAAMQKRKMQPFELAEECNISIRKATQYLLDFKPQHRRRLANWSECTKCDGRGNTKEF